MIVYELAKERKQVVRSNEKYLFFCLLSLTQKVCLKNLQVVSQLCTSTPNHADCDIDYKKKAHVPYPLIPF